MQKKSSQSKGDGGEDDQNLNDVDKDKSAVNILNQHTFNTDPDKPIKHLNFPVSKNFEEDKNLHQPEKEK